MCASPHIITIRSGTLASAGTLHSTFHAFDILKPARLSYQRCVVGRQIAAEKSHSLSLLPIAARLASQYLHRYISILSTRISMPDFSQEFHICFGPVPE